MSSHDPHSTSLNSPGLNSPGLDSTSPPRRRSRWTDVLLTACGVFVLTVLLMLASAFNPNAGNLTRFFDRHGLTMLGVEVGAILVVAIIVLIVERREWDRRIKEREAALWASGELEMERFESDVAGSEPPLETSRDQP